MSVFVFSVIVFLLPLPPCHSAASKESRKCMGEMRCYRRQLCRDKYAAREEKLVLFSTLVKDVVMHDSHIFDP